MLICKWYSGNKINYVNPSLAASDYLKLKCFVPHIAIGYFAFIQPVFLCFDCVTFILSFDKFLSDDRTSQKLILEQSIKLNFLSVNFNKCNFNSIQPIIIGI